MWLRLAGAISAGYQIGGVPLGLVMPLPLLRTFIVLYVVTLFVTQEESPRGAIDLLLSHMVVLLTLK